MEYKLNKKIIYNKIEPTFKYENLSKYLIEILIKRGYDTKDKISKFLNLSLLDLYDTRLMKDAEKGVDLILEHILKGNKIVIYGDYDCDGIGATATMLLALKNVGANVDYFINNRFEHGYGICIEGINQIISKNPDVKLIITVDNGIVGFDAVDYCNSKNIDIIITDHHEPGEKLPNAKAVINPKRNDDLYPFKELCGAGIAFKLMLLLYYKMNLPLNYIYNLVDIVALSTVGDIVPLIDENRIIVKEGLSLMKKETRKVFKYLKEITGTNDVNAHFTLAFLYVPMINAIGRVAGEVNLAVELFLTDDDEKIKEIICKLKELNEQRKKLTEKQYKLAEEILEKKGLKEVIVVYHPEFHEGIIGLIAGKLKEKYNRPTFVFSKHNDVLKGSARSIDNYHLKQIMDKGKEYLVGYGGHAKAGGLSLKEENLDSFEEFLIQKAKELLNEDDYKQKIYIDTVIDAKDLDINIIDELKILEPFGEGFEKPIIGLKNFEGDGFKYLGEEAKHVKIYNKNLSVIIWQEAEKYRIKNEPLKLKAIGYPELNVYNNNVNIQFIVQNDLFYSA